MQDNEVHDRDLGNYKRYKFDLMGEKLRNSKAQLNDVYKSLKFYLVILFFLV